MHGLDKVATLDFPMVEDDRGKLAFAEVDAHVPFPVARIFYLFDVPAGKSRGGHAHKEQHQMIVCLAGRVDIDLDDGERRRAHQLDTPTEALHVPPMIWTTLRDFSAGAVCLVLVSHRFEEADYVRDYDEFLARSRTHADSVS